MASPAEIKSKLQRQRVEALLWDWAEQGAREVNGHASVSPAYRMMCEWGGPGRSGGGRDQWRGRTRRVADELQVRPAQTCYGSETNSMKMPFMTRPEQDADRGGPVLTLDNVIRSMLTDVQQRIIAARYIERLRQMQDIAAELDMHRHDVSIIHRLTLDQIYRVMFEPVRDVGVRKSLFETCD